MAVKDWRSRRLEKLRFWHEGYHPDCCAHLRKGIKKRAADLQGGFSRKRFGIS
jgi:hypothetical protein